MRATAAVHLPTAYLSRSSTAYPFFVRPSLGTHVNLSNISDHLMLHWFSEDGGEAGNAEWWIICLAAGLAVLPLSTGRSRHVMIHTGRSLIDEDSVRFQEDPGRL